jgi:ATP-dependent Clp protease ATP-binding subunit ClpC
MEDGVLTASDGRKVSFKNAVIIMTSNVGANLITENKAAIGFAAVGADDSVRPQDKRVMDELKKTFKPEFINRVDDIIIFGKLEQGHIEEICRLLLSDVSKRAQELSITLSFADETVTELAKKGYDKAYGVRPLRRVITSKIEDMLSMKLLSGEISAGDNVKVMMKEEEFICSR